MSNQFSFDSEGKRSRNFGAVGARGNLSQDEDDLAILQGRATDSSHMTREERGWAWRQRKITESLFALKDPSGVSQEEKQQAIRQLGWFYAYELHKFDQIQRDLVHLEREKKEYEEILQDHARSWGNEVVEFGTRFERGK